MGFPCRSDSLFNDFEKGSDETEGRKRAGVSLALSMLVFAILAGGIGAAMATAKAVVDRRDRDMDVEFASLPEPEPEPVVEAPPPPPPVRRQARTERPAASRRDMGPPDGIPDEQPPEAEGDLTDAGDVGPVDGFIDGGGDDEQEAPPAPAPPPPAPAPPRPAPRQVRETISRPGFLSGCRAPEVPAGLLTQAATIRIDVRMLIGPEGNVLQARVLSGHALVPDELVLRCAREQRFDPARLPDGTAVPYPFRRRFVFRPANL